MELEKETIITLENKERYIINNITFYGGIKYALAQKEGTKEKIVLAEIFEQGELYVENVNDPELNNILLRILDF